jgi:hypothetical protein
VKKPPSEFVDDIPLGHAIFVVHEGGPGAHMMPDLMTFQTEGKLYKSEDIDPDIFDEEMLSVLDHLRKILRAKAEEELY